MFRKVVLAVAVGLLAIPMARADSIVIDGELLEDVIVREGGSFYYVQIPETGEIKTIRTSAVNPSDVRITDDAFHREELVAKWERNRGGPTQTELASANEAEWSLVDSARNEASSTLITNIDRPAPRQVAQASGRSGPMVAIEADGRVRRIRLNDVPLRQALKAILRTQNLDYAVEEGFIRVSTPERLRHESFEDLETRVYELAASGETLPKIVVSNPGGVVGTQAFGVGGMGGTLGGMSTLQGMGGMGGVGGFGGGGGGHFANISQLFNSGPQYDLLVGESPAVIMPMSMTFVEGPPRGRFLGFTDLGGARGVGVGAQQWNQQPFGARQQQWGGPGGIGRAGAYDYY